MAVQGASKPRLDTSLGCRQPSAVQPLGRAAFVALLLPAAPLSGQAPDLTLLWRVNGGVLTTPAPLQAGPIGVFWNPAAVGSTPGLAFGLEVLQTPDVVSMSSVLGGVTYRVGRALSLGVSAGRISVGDLVRTTTSPESEQGSIPVYTQFLGAAVGTAVGPLALGAQLRVHDARLDTQKDDGVTLDVGVQARPLSGLTIAVASQFATPAFAATATAAYSAAAEYRIAAGRLWGGRVAVLGRYGVELRGSGELEHMASAGVGLADRLRVDVALLRADAYGSATWQPVVGVELQIGRYVVGVARGNGLNGVGATYRISLNVGVLP
jgi:hypothetical protein